MRTKTSKLIAAVALKHRASNLYMAWLQSYSPLKLMFANGHDFLAHRRLQQPVWGNNYRCLSTAFCHLPEACPEFEVLLFRTTNEENLVLGVVIGRTDFTVSSS